MFKKGQLVRSKLTGCLYYIHAVVNDGRLEVGHVSHLGVGSLGRVRPTTNLELIGNNYQPFDDPRAWSARKAKGE